MTRNNLQSGDILIRSNGLFSEHYGIVVETNNSQPLVAENQRNNGVQIVSYDQFMAGKGLLNIQPYDGKEVDRKKVKEYIDPLIGKNYNLVQFNCDHFSPFYPEEKSSPPTFKLSIGVEQITGPFKTRKTLNRLTQNLVSLLF